MIKLTSVGHPDVEGGKQFPVYVDGTKVIAIAVSIKAEPKQVTSEQQRMANNMLNDEVSRIGDELRAVKFTYSEEKILQQTVQVKEAYAALSAATTMATRVNHGGLYHAPVVCTEVMLGAGTVEQTVMLARLFVKETPEEVHEILMDDWRKRSAPGLAGPHIKL